jgi:hypothetical protein
MVPYGASNATQADPGVSSEGMPVVDDQPTILGAKGGQA